MKCGKFKSISNKSRADSACNQLVYNVHQLVVLRFENVLVFRRNKVRIEKRNL